MSLCTQPALLQLAIKRPELIMQAFWGSSRYLIETWNVVTPGRDILFKSPERPEDASAFSIGCSLFSCLSKQHDVMHAGTLTHFPIGSRSVPLG